MECPEHGPMVKIKTEERVDLGFRGELFIQESYKCLKCKRTGASFTKMMGVKKGARR